MQASSYILSGLLLSAPIGALAEDFDISHCEQLYRIDSTRMLCPYGTAPNAPSSEVFSGTKAKIFTDRHFEDAADGDYRLSYVSPSVYELKILVNAGRAYFYDTRTALSPAEDGELRFYYDDIAGADITVFHCTDIACKLADGHYTTVQGLAISVYKGSITIPDAPELTCRYEQAPEGGVKTVLYSTIASPNGREYLECENRD